MGSISNIEFFKNAIEKNRSQRPIYITKGDTTIKYRYSELRKVIIQKTKDDTERKTYYCPKCRKLESNITQRQVSMRHLHYDNKYFLCC